jgi:hypothetical protein
VVKKCEEAGKVETNIRVLGWLYIVLGILGLLGGLVALFFMVTLGFVVPEREVFPILSVVGLFIAVIVTLVSAPGIVVGIGLLQFRSWARILAMVLAVLNLTAFPFGTALAIYTFVSLLTPEAERVFSRR